MKGFGRIGSGVIAAGTAAVVIAALSITSSQASWTDHEYDQGTFGALDCADNQAFDTTAWGRIVTAELAGAQIDPIAALNGITVDNVVGGLDGDDAASEAHDVATPNGLGDNAWSSDVDLSALGLINASVGAGLFAAPDTGVYTQYGQAHASGVSTGASGVITTSEGGVGLGSTDPNPPGIGSLSLQGILGEVIGDALGAAVANLADLSLNVGAVASSTTVDACAPIWDDEAAAVTRDYLIAGLGLSFRSDAVGALVTGITNLVNALDTNPAVPGTQIGVAVDASALGTSIQGLLGGLATAISVSGTGVSGTVTADLSGVLGLLDDEITDTDGFVSIDLGTGTITVDIEKILGSLNNLPANTPLLTPTVINTIITAIDDAVTDFVDDVLEDTLQAAFDLVTLDVDVDAVLTILGQGVGLHVDVAGPIAAPTVGVVLNTTGVLGLLTTLLSGLGIDVNALLADITSTLTTGIVAPLTSAIATQLDDVVVGLLDGVLDGGNGGLLPDLITALTPVLNLVRSIVDITVNVQPDAAPNPDAPIPPDIPVPGRYFESALRISLLDPVGNASDGLVEVYLANSSAGPNTLR